MSRTATRVIIGIAIAVVMTGGWLLFGSTTTDTMETEYQCKRVFGRVTRITATSVTANGSIGQSRREIFVLPWSESTFSCMTAVEIASGTHWAEEDD
jgi:hypothetical protein